MNRSEKDTEEKTNFIFDTLASVANVVKVQSDGKIIPTGNSLTCLYEYGIDFTVMRLQANGNLDNSFGNEGIVPADFDIVDDTLTFYNGVVAADGTINKYVRIENYK
ncbi:hypothetical protein BH10BAC2_BH10BAC2_17620 [soil metagenome]